MKTILPQTIGSKEDAEKFLLDLISNREEYHPEDNAHDVVFTFSEVSNRERDKLNALMAQAQGFVDIFQFIEDKTKEIDDNLKI